MLCLTCLKQPERYHELGQVALKVQKFRERLEDSIRNGKILERIATGHLPRLSIVRNDPPAYARRSTPCPMYSGWRALSIFSGCGGLDLGFLQEGFFSEKAIDIDEIALATYRNNLSDVVVKADLSTSIPLHHGCDLLLAGAPCQGFSTAGKRQVHDPRNDLLTKVADIALANQPKVVVVENVPAALSGSHRHHWESLEGQLRDAGYNVRRILIEGDKSGLAQRRKRLFLLCWMGSDCINVSFPSSGSLTLRDALRKLPAKNKDNIIWPLPDSKDAKIVACIKQGQKLSNVRVSERAVATWEVKEAFGQVSQNEKDVLYAVARLRRRERARSFGDGDPVSLRRLNQYFGGPTKKLADNLVETGFLRKIGSEYELAQTYNGKYRRLSWNELSPTVDTRFGRIDLFVHPDEDRGITQREAARIQGFPDVFDFCGNRSQQFVQIGNAVPPPMASKLAEFIRDAIMKA